MRLIKKIATKANKLQVPVVLAGLVILLALPFVESRLGWLAFVALVPLFYALDIMHARKWSTKRTVLAVWLSGWVFLLIVMSFILQINTDNWSYISSSPLTALVIFTWLSCAFVMSLGFVLFGWLVCRYKVYGSSVRCILVVPAAWVIAEFFRSWITSVVFIGPQGSIGAFFNFGNLGFAATNTPVGYAARVVGLYGLGFLVILINICFYWLMKRKWRPALLAGLVVIALIMSGYFVYKIPAVNTKHIAAVQVGRTDQRFYESQLLDLAKSQTNDRFGPAEVVALPEYANFFEQGNADSRQSVIDAVTKGQPALFVYSRSKSPAAGLLKNEIVYRQSDGTELSTQGKNFLIPTGEYLPYFHQFILKLIGQDQIVNVFNANLAIAKGSSPEHPITYNSVTYGALACSGAIAPQLYRNLANQGAEVLINSASLNVFKNSPLYREQSESMIRFSAVANARPFVQSARGNRAYIFDQNGRILTTSDELGINLLRADINPSTTKTLYTRFGEYMVIISALILAGFALARRSA